MGWSIGHDDGWNRDIGYGVPAWCDHPKCNAEIDRGLAYVCGGEPYGGEHGCGLFFCDPHLTMTMQLCEQCLAKRPPFEPKPDHPRWIRHKLTDPTWAGWRAVNASEVEALRATHGEATDGQREPQRPADGRDGAA